MNGIGFEESKVYTLVTDLSELTEGSEVIIAAAGHDVAISTTQNNNNRAQASVTKSESTITDPGDNVQIFTLENGTKDNTVAFNTGKGYIYAASSSSNCMRTQELNNDNGSFAIEINENGIASIVAQGTNTRNTIRYNSATNNGQVFSCYESGKQSDVSLYKLKGSGNADKPLIVVDDTEYTITVADAENGTVEASSTAAKKGTEITLTITPNEGYVLDILSVTDEENNKIAVEDNAFVMPASNVTVSASFKVIPQGYTITWNATNNSQSVSSYVNSWQVTSDGLTLTMENWNNNSNKWDYVKAGSKNDAYVSTITSASIQEVIQSVTITIDAVTVSSINSLYLEVSSSSDFSEASSYPITIATGDQSVNISSPAAKLYYRIVVDCKKGSSNGLITISKLVFATN